MSLNMFGTQNYAESQTSSWRKLKAAFDFDRQDKNTGGRSDTLSLAISSTPSITMLTLTPTPATYNTAVPFPAKNVQVRLVMALNPNHRMLKASARMA